MASILKQCVLNQCATYISTVRSAPYGFVVVVARCGASSVTSVLEIQKATRDSLLITREQKKLRGMQFVVGRVLHRPHCIFGPGGLFLAKNHRARTFIMSNTVSIDQACAAFHCLSFGFSSSKNQVEKRLTRIRRAFYIGVLAQDHHVDTDPWGRERPLDSQLLPAF